MYEVKINYPHSWGNGITALAQSYFYNTWEDALKGAIEHAKKTPQGRWIDVYTPCGTHVAHIMGLT